MRSRYTTSLGRYWATVLTILIFLWAITGSGANLSQLMRGMPNAVDYAKGMFPPDWSILPGLWEPILEQIQMSIVAVIVATLITLPLSFLAARGTTPSFLVYILAHGIITFCRGIPTMIWALLCVSVMGLGPLPGMVALTLHCIGGLGKYFVECIEATILEIREIMDAMRIDGASEWQALYHGLARAAAPYFLSYILTYLEWSLRVGSALGLVGAGGLGTRLAISIKLFRRQQTLTICLVILSLVTIVDIGSWHVRRRFMI